MAKTTQLNEEKKAIRRIMDKLALIYEAKVWTPLIWQLFGGLSAPSYWRIAGIIAEKTEIKEGCGALNVVTGSGATAMKLGKLAGEELPLWKQGKSNHTNPSSISASMKIIQNSSSKGNIVTS